MPPAPSLSLLFHPKKPKIQKKEPSIIEPKAAPATPPLPPKPEENPLQLPDGPYQEFKLMSSALNGWKYDVMKFDSRKPIDISTWQAPIKLNRKDPHREESSSSMALEAVGPMLGLDGKPVIGPDGKIVMVDIEGRPILQSFDGNGSEVGAKGKAPATNGRKKFQKKTRQVFLVPEATRQLRKEEKYPWVMEDSTRKEVWVGQLEEVSKSETHAFFMPAANDVFKFVPAHRWYKFQRRPNHYIPSLEEAESIMARVQKNKDPERWLLHNRNGKAPSAATSAIFKAETEGRALSGGSPFVYNASQSLGPGGRKLKTVDSGIDRLFDEDDEDEGTKKRKAKRFGGDGDLDEIVYEGDFADDDEKMDGDNEDEEAKEIEERLKREYKSANKQREGFVDESDEDEEPSRLTKEGEKMKKLILHREKNAAYESDDERNPYASSEEEEEDEPPPAPTQAAVQHQQTPQIPSRSGSQTPKTAGTLIRPQPPSQAGSRATSPIPASMGGHSVVAKRATSPKGPKAIVNVGSRGSSPLNVSQAATPLVGSRATSPAVGSRAGSPVGQVSSNGTQKANNKRKASEDVSGGGVIASTAAAPKPKKRKSTAQSGAAPAGELEDRMVVEWLRTTPSATTRDCIQHFTPYLTDEAKKSKFTALVKEVAQLKGGVLVLRNGYRSPPVP